MWKLDALWCLTPVYGLCGLSLLIIKQEEKTMRSFGCINVQMKAVSLMQISSSNTAASLSKPEEIRPRCADSSHKVPGLCV